MKRTLLVRLSSCLIVAFTAAFAQTRQTSPSSNPATQSHEERMLLPGRTSLNGAMPAELKVRRIARTGHLLVSPQINGQDAGWFIFDTGAGQSCVDKSVVERLDLPEAGVTTARGSGGNQATSFRRAQTLALGPLLLEDTRLVELDLRAISLAVGEELAGIIGYDCIAAAIWEIDIAGARILMHDPVTYALPDEGKWDELTFESRRACVSGRIEQNEPGPFVLDTGANTAIAVHGPSVRAFNLLDGRETRKSMMGGVGGMRSARTGRLSSITIAGQQLADVDATFSEAEDGALQDPQIQATVGLPALKNFVLIVDYAKARVALLPPRPLPDAAANESPQ